MRPLVTAAALSVALVAALAACGSDARPVVDPAPDCPTTGTYVVGGVLDEVNGSVVTLSNGFPVGQRIDFMAMMAPGTRIDVRTTPALVSGENAASVSVVPFVRRAAGGVVAGPVRLRLWVCDPSGDVVAGTVRDAAAVDSAFAAWSAGLEARWAGWAAMEGSALAAAPGARGALADSVATDPRASRYGAGPALDSARAWAARNPFVVETTFQGPAEPRPHDAIFREAPAIRGTAADSARLRDYAVRLRDLNVAGDTAALAEEFAPRIRLGLGTTVGEERARYAAAFREGLVLASLVPFEADDVELTSWAGGRIWELKQNGVSLITTPRDDGSWTSTDIFVGLVDDTLRIVR